MTPGAIALLSFSMSTDAFAAAVSRGASQSLTWARAAKAGLVFGIVEAITPIIGWGLGLIAASFVERVDHWIAFILLSAVGLSMIRNGFSELDEAESLRASSPVALLATAIGTSIDAAAVGVGLAFIGANIWVIAASIGFTTFLFTTCGMMIGGRLGSRFGKRTEVVGGLLLAGIGCAILIDHLGLLV